jgi:hypothetical protein
MPNISALEHSDKFRSDFFERVSKGDKIKLSFFKTLYNVVKVISDNIE